MIRPGMLLVMILLAFRVQGAGEVSISGYFPGAEGETVHLMTYEDMISRQQLKLSSVLIDGKGNFGFTLPLKESRLLFLRVFNAKNYFYAAPGEKYVIEYEQLVINDPEADEARLFRQRSFNVTVRGEAQDQKHLHTMILQLDDMVATFLEDEVAGRVRANHRASLERFSQQVDSVFGDPEQPFFKEYSRYYMANLQRSLNVRGFMPLFHNYVKDQPILLDHPVYMDFFGSMFDNYIFSAGRSIRMHDLEEAVNRHGSFEGLLEVLANDSLLQDEALRELVLLMSIDKMFSMPDFFNSRLFLVLEEAGRKSKFPAYRKIAENIAQRYRQHFHEGAFAADFRLSDMDGNVYDLHDYRDAYLYLFFWAGWCPLSMQSIDAMEEIADEFHGRLELIGVLVDRDRQTVQHLLQDAERSFQLLHFDGDYGLLGDFGVTTVPFYILIRPGGRIQKHPFVPPHWGAREALQDILSN